MKNIAELLQKLEITPKDITIFEKACTHPSFNADANTKHQDYERLEFLGDSVLGCIVCEIAYDVHPNMDQGLLTKLKSALVSTDALSAYAKELSYHEYIRVGNSFAGKVIDSKHVLEDVFEASVGAMFLDQGFDFTRKFVTKVMYENIKNFNIDDLQDYKSRLQEEMQGEHREAVTYEIINTTGPAHDKRFKVRVVYDGMTIGVGEGASKKAAEQMAAKAALEKKAEK